jgi:hypothetical protein
MHKPKSKKSKKEQKLKRERLRNEREEARRNSPTAQKERKIRQKLHAVQILAQSKAGTRNPKEAIKALYNGEKIYIPTSSPLHGYQTMFSIMEHRNKADKNALFHILCHCENQGVSFYDTQRQGGRSFSNALIGLATFHDFWLRPLEDWEPPSYNIHKQFSSLVRHLLAKYDVPLFMDDAFYTNNSAHQDWFIHIGTGNNIRTATNLPIPLTKAMAHHFLQAPNDFDVMAAIRWGQVIAMGGDERLVRAFLQTRIGTSFVNNDFWASVIQWFMENPMLDTAQYAPIIDWINHQKYTPSVPNPDENGPRMLPAQPNISMKKRSVDATIKAMEEWHKQTGRARRGAEKYWEGSGIPEFHYEEGEHNKKIYTITELLTAKELQEEGAAMLHCVGSYSHSCATGRVSIWSMKEGYGTRMLTIEVDNATKVIRQARGKYNEKPKGKAGDIMNRWAMSAGLNISRWLI